MIIKTNKLNNKCVVQAKRRERLLPSAADATSLRASLRALDRDFPRGVE